MASHVVDLATFYGADQVGVVKLADDRFGIVCALEADYDPRTARGIGGQTPAMKGQFATFTVAAFIRELGYEADCVTRDDAEQLAARAGLGPGSGRYRHVADVIETTLPLERDRAVTYVIAQPCIGEKNGACVDVCPAGCIHTTPDAPQNYIDPDVCIECEQCVLVCPVDAVFLDKELPSEWQPFVEVNAEFFTRNKAACVFPDAEVARMFDAIQAICHARWCGGGDCAGGRQWLCRRSRGDVRAEACGADAERKAYTAMSYGLGTHELKATSKPLWLNESAVDPGRVLMAPGGVPLVERGETLGAIGVAGAGAQDMLCAQAAFSTSAHV